MVKQPVVGGIVPLQKMTSFQTEKKGTPLAYKSLSNLYPKAFNSGIKHRWSPHKTCMVESTKQNHQDWYIPIFASPVTTHPGRNTMLDYCINKHVNLKDSFWLVVWICLKSSDLSRRKFMVYVEPAWYIHTLRVYPSATPWRTIPHAISLWCPSICHNALSRGTLYFLRSIFFPTQCCIPCPSLSMQLMASTTHYCWIRSPCVARRCPII